MMDSNNSLKRLPEGWVWTRLGEIAFLNPKFTNDVSDDFEVSFIPMKHLEELTGQADLSLTKRYFEVKKGYTAFRNGDVIFAKITPCMENGKIGIVKDLKNGVGFGSTEFHVIRLLNSQMPNTFLFFFLVRESFRRDARMHMTGSAGQLRVPRSYLEEVSYPLPPLPEQHRIVAKIEDLFTRLGAGVEGLKKVRAQLKGYRRAVLKHAFEGKLTAEWREAHKNELEPASVLLERIKEERKKNAKGKYKQQPPLDTSDLLALPEGWIWARVNEVGRVETGATPSKSKAEYYGKDYPFYKPTDLNAGYYTKESNDGLTNRGIEEARLLPERSILVTCIGATIGKTGFIRRAGSSNQQINAILPEQNILPEYVYFVCTSSQFQKSIIEHASATTLPILSKKKFEILPLPLPPLPEQHKIVEEIERHFSVADQMESVVEQSLIRAGRLRQSILKRAFEGKLVLQDPNDEPAEKLLERIKAEKANREAEKKAEGKSRKTSNAMQGRLM